MYRIPAQMSERTQSYLRENDGDNRKGMNVPGI
jgi:hypothetical protein